MISARPDHMRVQKCVQQDFDLAAGSQYDGCADKIIVEKRLADGDTDARTPIPRQVSPLFEIPLRHCLFAIGFNSPCG